MEFHIKSGSLPHAIAKSLLFATATLLIGFVILLVPIIIIIVFMGSGVELSALLNTLSMGFLEKPLPFSIFFLGLFAVFLLPYFHRHDRLWIDDRGIRFDGRFQSRWSWNIAWQDVQLPITYHPSCDWLIPKNMRGGTLYIQLNQQDDDQQKDKKKWYSFLFIRLSGRIPSNPVFAIGKVSAWQAANESDDKRANVEKDKRPSVVREIERHLGQGAITKRFFPLHTLAEQARETQRKKIASIKKR
ncbi:MAG: hypothetical protein LBP90_02420 [Burkholderiales bacterium]|jgi:hypothetical protein|nr:hypothetical protein [Burkholderiales bacterium]